MVSQFPKFVKNWKFYIFENLKMVLIGDALWQKILKC